MEKKNGTCGVDPWGQCGEEAFQTEATASAKVQRQEAFLFGSSRGPFELEQNAPEEKLQETKSAR